MKKTFIILFLLGLSLGTARPARAQVQIAIQLGLNIQKLNQLRKILQNMYDGYKILTEGYNKIKNVVQGNYKIHEAFLDGLMAVSPAVKNYKRVADIISAQKKYWMSTKKPSAGSGRAVHLRLQSWNMWARCMTGSPDAVSSMWRNC